MSSLSRTILLIVLLILSAFFAMAESALSYCNQIKLRSKAEEGSKSASLVLKTLDKFDNSIIDILICTNIVHILFSVIATILSIELISESSWNVDATEMGTLIATIGSTIVVFLFGEIIPKTIAKARADDVSRLVIYPMTLLGYILLPVSIVFRGLLKLTRKIFKNEKKNILISEDDFQDIIDDIAEDGIIEEEESEIIQSAVDFDDLKVKEVMCPRHKIVALNINKIGTKEELIDFICDNNFSRIPVYKNNLNNILGILHTRTLLKTLMTSDEYDIEKLLVEPLYVKPNVHLDTIFEEFKRKKTHIAIVTDKDDKTIGLVTMEDVLEELVGDIDESDEGGIDDE